MPRPSPRPVVKLSTKMLTSVKSVKRYMTKKVPMIAVMPMTSGIADATIAPKTKSKSKKVNGIEMNSAVFRSSWIRPLMALAKTAAPET